MCALKNVFLILQVFSVGDFGMACFVGMKPQLEPMCLRTVQTTPALTPWVRHNHIWIVTVSSSDAVNHVDSTAGVTCVTCSWSAPEKDFTAGNHKDNWSRGDNITFSECLERFRWTFLLSLKKFITWWRSAGRRGSEGKKVFAAVKRKWFHVKNWWEYFSLINSIKKRIDPRTARKIVEILKYWYSLLFADR